MEPPITRTTLNPNPNLSAITVRCALFLLSEGGAALVWTLRQRRERDVYVASAWQTGSELGLRKSTSRENADMEAA